MKRLLGITVLLLTFVATSLGSPPRADGRKIGRAVKRVGRTVGKAVKRGARKAGRVARKALSAGKKIAGKAMSAGKKLAKGAGKAAQKVGKGVAKAAKSVGKAAGKIGKKVVETAGKVVKTAGKVVGQVINKVVDTVKGLVNGETPPIPVWPAPPTTCVFKLKDIGGSVKACVNKVASKTAKAIPFLKKPIELISGVVELVAEAGGKAKQYAKDLLACAKNSVGTAMSDGLKLMTALFKNPVESVQRFFSGAFAFLKNEASHLFGLLKPQKLLSAVAALVKVPARSPGEAPAGPQAMLKQLSGGLAEKLASFVSGAPAQLFSGLDHWRISLSERGVKGPFKCFDVIRRAMNDFKGPIVSVLGAIAGKAKDVMTLVGPALQKVFEQGFAVVAELLANTTLFKRVRDAVSAAFLDKASHLDETLVKVMEALRGGGDGAAKTLQSAAREVVSILPFSKTAFWLQLAKAPIKEKVTALATDFANAALDSVFGAVRGLVINLVNRIIGWASEGIPYVSYVLSEIGPVITWLARAVWDMALDPALRTVAQQVVAVGVEQAVDHVVEAVAGVLAKGAERVDAELLSETSAPQLPGATAGLFRFLLKLYKEQVEPRISSLKAHTTRLERVLLRLGGKGAAASAAKRRAGAAGGAQ